MSTQNSETHSLSPRFIRYEGSVNIVDTMSQGEILMQVWDEIYGDGYRFITIQANEAEEVEQVEGRTKHRIAIGLIHSLRRMRMSR